MSAPTFAELIQRPARLVTEPDYGILDEIEFERFIGNRTTSGHTQIFREKFSDLRDREVAMARLHKSIDQALAHGVGGIIDGVYRMRLMDGAERLVARFGHVPDYRWRLAILRPLEIRHNPAEHPTLEEKAKAAEMGLEVVGSIETWEYLVECGLDIDPRIAQPEA